MESRALFEEKVILSPRDLSKREIQLDSLLLEKLRIEREGSCSLHGYVKPGTLQILSRSLGYVEKGRYTGDIVFVVQAEAKVLNAPDGLVLQGDVLRSNKMGMYVNYMDAIRIILPRDLHIGNEEYDSVRIGETVELEIKKSRFQVNDEYILGVGLFRRRVAEGEPKKATVIAKKEDKPIVEDQEIELEAEAEAEPEQNEATVPISISASNEEEGEEGTTAPPPSSPNTLYFQNKLENPYKPLNSSYLAPITLDGKTYPSVEHYVQAMKFPSDSDYQETIRTAKTAAKAKTLARSQEHPIRENWENSRIDFMKKALEAKFTQHPELKTLLLSTGNQRLVEANKEDAFWGMGRTGKGKNKLGELLMDLRTQFQAAEKA